MHFLPFDLLVAFCLRNKQVKYCDSPIMIREIRVWAFAQQNEVDLTHLTVASLLTGSHGILALFCAARTQHEDWVVKESQRPPGMLVSPHQSPS